MRKQKRDWSEYNKSLTRRGSITLWIEEGFIQSWKANPTLIPEDKGFQYSNFAISTCLVIKNVFHLGYRQCQGFLQSILDIMEVSSVKAPCYSTLCRRAAFLKIPLSSHQKNKGEPMIIAVDSSGLKVHGEGEWQSKVHGKTKRRLWRKIHVAIDTHTGEIKSFELTDSKDSDGKVFRNLLDQISEPIQAVCADGAYDFISCYEDVCQKNAQPLFNIRKNGKFRHKAPLSPGEEARNHNLSVIQKIGEKKWKQYSGYHQRSLVENTFSRLKTIFKPTLYSRKFEKQKVEAQVKCAILNKMNAIRLSQEAFCL